MSEGEAEVSWVWEEGEVGGAGVRWGWKEGVGGRRAHLRRE